MAAIDGIGRTGTARLGARGPARNPAGAFSVPAEAATATAETAEAAPAAALASMLSLQELGGNAAQDREARRHGQEVLAALATLQRALLVSGDDAAALQQLGEMLAAVPRASDPRLAAIVSAIVVRAKVELARRRL